MSSYPFSSGLFFYGVCVLAFSLDIDSYLVLLQYEYILSDTQEITVHWIYDFLSLPLSCLFLSHTPSLSITSKHSRSREEGSSLDLVGLHLDRED